MAVPAKFHVVDFPSSAALSRKALENRPLICTHSLETLPSEEKISGLHFWCVGRGERREGGEFAEGKQEKEGGQPMY